MLGSEIGLMFRRRRTWAMLGALAAVPVLIGIAVRVSTSQGGSVHGPPFLDRVAGNGLFTAVVAMVVCIPLFLPLTVAVASGDSISGEAAHGTLRYLLLAPVSRGRLLATKYAGVVVFCMAAPLTVAVFGVATGMVLFSTGPVTLLSGATIGPAAALGRVALIAAYIAVSLCGLGAVGLFVSTLTDVPIGAMAAVAVLAVAVQIAGQLPQLDWLHPWLFSYHWLGFADMLREPIDWTGFRQNGLLQAGYAVVFGALAYGRFRGKDVLS